MSEFAAKRLISEKKLREIVNDNNFADIYKDYRITAPVLQSRCEVITFSTKNQNTIPKKMKKTVLVILALLGAICASAADYSKTRRLDYILTGTAK